MPDGYIRINTDAFVAHLTRAKMPKAQAEAVAHAIEQEIHVDSTALVNKGDLTHAIEMLRRDLTIEIHKSRVSIIGIITGIIGVMIAALGIVIILVLG